MRVGLSADDYAAMAELFTWEHQPWRRQARCLGGPGDYFWPDTGDQDVGDPGLRRARLLCATCPVRRPCLVESLNSQHGVWGGTVPQQRERVADRADAVRLLDEEFFWIATTGPWRVVDETEWVPLGDLPR